MTDTTKPADQTPAKTLGQIGFEAYNTQAGGKTHEGKKTPAWADLGEKVQANWEAAGRAIMEVAQAQTAQPMPDLTALALPAQE